MHCHDDRIACPPAGAARQRAMRRGVCGAVRQLGEAARRLHRARDLRGQLLGRALARLDDDDR